MGHLLHKRRDYSEVKARGVLGEAEGSSLQRDGSLVVCLVLRREQVVVVQVTLVCQAENITLTATVEIERYNLFYQVRVGLVSHLQFVQKLLLLSNKIYLVDHKLALLIQTGNDKLASSHLLLTCHFFPWWSDRHLLKHTVCVSVVLNC